MSNPFKKILEDEKLPEYLKERVIDNVNFIKLSIDVSGLFMVELPKTLHSALDEGGDEKELKKIVDRLNKNNKDD